MGHAGAWRGAGERTAKEKYAVLEAAGATMVQHPEDFGGVMKTLLSQSGRDVGKIVGNAQKQQQKRGYHTMRRRPVSTLRRQPSRIAADAIKQQHRSLLLGPDQPPAPLEPYLSQAGVSLSDTEAPEDAFHLGVTVDRTARSPCLAVSPSTHPSQLSQRLRHFPYDWREGPTDATIKSAIAHMQLDAAPPAARAQTTALLRALAKMYTEKEAVTLSAAVSIDTASGDLVLHQPTLHLQFDDAAFRSCARQEDIHSLRRKDLEDPAELEAETHGIVFLTLPSPSPASSTAAQEPNIGTLVNGAGLAMNTLDALALQHSGTATNFLDTGGKATAATVKKSFELILQDPRVK
ncbi:hypothetical protein LTR48_007599, partial [Friedmanniomyces endolithicus]